ncbi:MAG: DNA polymerase domain-containing protein [Candidatus Thorarchaeota archaeon]|jgi:DNA polymerase elongation subunit (family B)
MSRTGWLLDCNVDWEKQALTLWSKENEKTKGYTYRGFNPTVFVSTDLLESNDWTETGILRAVREHPKVTDLKLVEKFASVYDKEKTQVLKVSTTPDALREVAGDLEKLPGATVYHADIDPVQQFFIDQTLFAFGRVEFELKGTDEVTKISSLDERENPEYDIPELEELGFEVFVDTDQIFPRLEDRIHHIEVYYDEETIRIEDSHERSILVRFQSLIDRIDPDVIVTGRGDESLFRYLSLRAKVNGVHLRLSRDGSPLKVIHREAQSFWQYNRIVFRSGTQVTLNGRIHIDRGKTGMHLYSPTGLEGVVESCRLALGRPQRVSRMTIGGVNAAVQYYRAYKMDILIPPVKRNPEFLKSVTELTAIDRGGLILQPRPDIYEDIAECDFSSMYPTLMVKQNISPETICTLKDSCPYNYEHCIEIPQQSFRICTHKRGIVSESLKLLVDRRMAFKSLIEGGQDAKRYEFIQNTLKGVLVSCFGYLGFKNAKFGRVEAHTAVTALSREVMLKTQDIGEEMGLEMIHGIVDSVWLKAKGEIEYENVREFCERVTEEVDIKMSPKGVYRWMVIPSSRLHPSVAPLNRYYGVYKHGGIKTRGIETRRRDTCLYVGDCQKEMIKTLARGRDKAGFLKQIPEAYAVCQEFIGRLHDDNVDLRDLILNSTLTRNPHEYRATSRAAVVAQQLVKAGRDLNAGQKVRYVMTSADSENPLRRVRALELFDASTRYDPDAYATLCQRAFENLIPAQYLESSEMDSEQTLLIPST